MKTTVLRLLLLLLPLLLALRFTASAQNSKAGSSKLPGSKETGIATAVPGESVHCYYYENQLVIQKLRPDEFDKAAVHNMQGAVVLRQKITAATMRMDATSLSEGVYVLVLSSSLSLKEKSFKVVVRK